ncbi:TrkH family potassium uptake protein [Actinomycetota bacterium]
MAGRELPRGLRRPDATPERTSRPLEAMFANPARVVISSFLAVIAVGTLLLRLPAATETGYAASWHDALVTAVSATCVTGLMSVDVGGHWSTLGELIVLGLFQIGGLGVMTMGSLLAVLVGRRLGMRSADIADAEYRGSVKNEDAKRLVLRIVTVSLVVEALTSLALFLRFWLGYDEPVGKAAYNGIFHGISAFNCAGISLKHNSLVDHVDDPYINIPVMIAVTLGGIGFPVIWDLLQRWRKPSSWSLHSKITVLGSIVLFVGGWLAFLLLEWGNRATMGSFSVLHKVMSAAFHSSIARTAGFNTLDIGQLQPETRFILDGLMFVGGGSAGTAGGIKITTFALLAYVIWSELRGEPTVHVAKRRLSSTAIRQAVTVALLSVGVVGLGTMTLLLVSDASEGEALFEAVAAFSTAGLSSGLFTELNQAGQLVLCAMMFIGRLGTLTLGTGLALRDRPRRYEFPEERIIVG